MCFKIILKVTKNQGSTLFIEDTFFKKPHGGGGCQFDPPLLPPGRLGLSPNFQGNQMKWARDNKYLTTSAILEQLNIFIIMCIYIFGRCLLKVSNVMLRQSSADLCCNVVVLTQRILKSGLGFHWWDMVNSMLEHFCY